MIHLLELGSLEMLAAEILGMLRTVESTLIIHGSGLTMKKLGDKRVVSNLSLWLPIVRGVSIHGLGVLIISPCHTVIGPTLPGS